MVECIQRSPIFIILSKCVDLKLPVLILKSSSFHSVNLGYLKAEQSMHLFKAVGVSSY